MGHGIVQQYSQRSLIPVCPCPAGSQSEPRQTQQKQFSFSSLDSGTASWFHLFSPKVEFFPSLIIQCNIHFLSPHEPHIPMCSNQLCKNQLGRSCTRPKHLTCPALTTSTENVNVIDNEMINKIGSNSCLIPPPAALEVKSKLCVLRFVLRKMNTER